MASNPIVDYAMAQIGKKYIWGASGPNAFDCSGLVMAAYSQTDIYLPHQSGLQASWFKARDELRANNKTNRGDAQPGDVVFWYGSVNQPKSITHCGIFVARQDGHMMCVAAVDEQYGVIEHRLNWALPPVGFGFNRGKT